MEATNVDQNVIFPYKLQGGQGLGKKPALGSFSRGNNSQRLGTKAMLIKGQMEPAMGGQRGRVDGSNKGT